jgi:hypothetical protein
MRKSKNKYKFWPVFKIPLAVLLTACAVYFGHMLYVKVRYYYAVFMGYKATLDETKDNLDIIQAPFNFARKIIPGLSSFQQK